MSTTVPTVHHTTSADGARIGFELSGTGPGLVLVQGAMGTAYNFRELAQALADAFTVVVPDRRGRGLSPHPFDRRYSIDDDVRDLEAVLAATGARFVFGLSAGADITLRAGLALPAIEKIAMYEPEIFPDGIPKKGIERFEAYAAADDIPGMLVTGMKMAQFGPAMLRSLPDWMLKPAVARIMKKEAKAPASGYATMTDLAGAFRYDVAVVQAMDESLPTFAALTQPVLLLGGSKSPAYLRAALDQLEQTIPHTMRAELPGLDHGAAWNNDPQRNPHGNPETVAKHLTAFFAAE